MASALFAGLSCVEPTSPDPLRAFNPVGPLERSAAAGPLSVSRRRPTGPVVSGAQSVGFVVDGSAQEWGGVDPLATAPGQAVTSLKATFNEDSLFFAIEGTGLGEHHSLYLNTDGDPATGFSGRDGADYLIQGGRLYRALGTGWNWSDLGADAVQDVRGASGLELAVTRAALGAMAQTITVRFDALDSAWCELGGLPVGASARLSLRRFGTGLIVPAYLGVPSRNPADPTYDGPTITHWTVLAEGALTFKNASATAASHDYWVIVNSGHNGPFDQADASDVWDRAASLWDPIRANGGVIFGYVHASVSPVEPLVEQYRSLSQVKDEISAWVKGYPRLGGIWIDEFYPRFEIANADWTAFFPNGEQNAPSDRAWYESHLPDGRPNWDLPVEPAGGYFDQLTRWIRATYPNLRIIGNAGGRFDTNQRAYSRLVDVTCSFEQSLGTAQTNPASGALDWSGLDRDPLNFAPGQLALIHRNSTDLKGAIEQAITKGYSHVFTTDRRLEENLWGGIPPYFADEVRTMASLPPTGAP